VFETALLSQRRQNRRTSVFVAALGAHAVLLGGVVAAQYWKVDAVVEPQVNDVFHVSLPMPALEKPAVQKKAATPPPQKQDVVVPTPTPPVAPPVNTQPTIVPDAIPPTPPTAGSDVAPDAPQTGSGSSGSQDGVPFAIGTGGDDSSGPIQIGQGITPPVTLTRVSPLYTESARRARIQGVVILEAVIDREGNVGEVKLLKGLGFGLDENAANAVARWKFKPAHAGDGRAVAVYFRLTVDYHLN